MNCEKEMYKKASIARKIWKRKLQLWKNVQENINSREKNSLDCFVVRIRVIVSVSFPRTSEYRILSLNWFLMADAFFPRLKFLSHSVVCNTICSHDTAWYGPQIASLNHILKTWLNNCKACLNLKRSQEGESCQPSLSLSSPWSSSQPL